MSDESIEDPTPTPVQDAPADPVQDPIPISPNPVLELEIANLRSAWEGIAAIPAGARLLVDLFGMSILPDEQALQAQLTSAYGAVGVQSIRLRWIGKGVLTVPVGGGFSGVVKTFRPGDTVSDPEHLRIIGARRVRELVANGQAEIIPDGE